MSLPKNGKNISVLKGRTNFSLHNVGVTSHTPRIFFPKVFPMFISHHSVSYILGNIPLGEYSLQFTLQFDQLSGV
jgi:hypothetical protein